MGIYSLDTVSLFFKNVGWSRVDLKCETTKTRATNSDMVKVALYLWKCQRRVQCGWWRQVVLLGTLIPHAVGTGDS
jgi:hypothetical protein